MKKHNLIVLGFGMALLSTACRKADVQQSKTEEASSVSNTAANWISLSNWSKQSEENYAVYSHPIEDKTITSAIAEDGMVLAFKKQGNTITALPVEEKNGDNSYFWYYQVSEGSVVINADAYGTTVMPVTAQTFTYYVISADQLKELEQKGYSKAELMRLNYETARKVIKP